METKTLSDQKLLELIQEKSKQEKKLTLGTSSKVPVLKGREEMP